MQVASIPANEAERLAALQRYAILDTPVEEVFNRLTRLAASLFKMPISLLSLVDSDRQWFKAAYGLDVFQTGRDEAFCAHTILNKNTLVVEDALEDNRFVDSPLVVGEPNIRFYAGAPLQTPDGYNLGTLCVIDRQPRSLTPGEVNQLQELAAIAMDELEFRAKLLKQARQSLRESEAKYRTLVEQIPAVTFAALPGETTSVVFISPQIEALVGYSAEEWLSNSLLWAERVHPEDRPRVMNQIKEHTIKHVPFRAEYRMLTRDGRTIWVLDQGKIINNEAGQPFLYQGVVFDITERKLAEEERLKASKLESLGVLAGGLAHDFNNLLTTILGNLSLIGTADNDLEVEEYVREAEKASLRARELTLELLTFAKGGEPVKKPGALSGLIREATRFALQGTLAQANIRLATNLWPVEADQGQLSRVIHNIVLNAAQALPANEPGRLEIEAHNVQPDEVSKINLPTSNYIEIAISDNGMGIPAELLPKIFDPYFTTKSQGSGLGLATVYSIVKKHDGYITVESETDKGTTFYLYLPAYIEPSRQRSEKETNPPRLKTMRVLVMDDETGVQRVIQRMLQKLEYEVELTEDGEQALARYEEAYRAGQPFDLVVMDLMVPKGKMGGTAATKELLKRHKDAKVIVSSGYSSDPAMANPTSYGFKDVLTKPYKLEELDRVVKRVLAKA